VLTESVGQGPAAITGEVRASPPSAESDGRAAWDWLKESGNAAALTDFIARYPSSALADDARVRRAALERAEKELEVQRAHRDEAMIRLTQKELLRIGCFPGPVDGNFNDATQAGIRQYELQFGQASDATQITEQLISDLKARTGRVCPLVCGAGQAAQGNQCIAARKPVPAAARQATKAKAEEPRTRPAARAQPSGRREAGSPSRPSGGLFIGIGGGGFGIGAGF
jgi:hypothetical protein